MATVAELSEKEETCNDCPDNRQTSVLHSDKPGGQVDLNILIFQILMYMLWPGLYLISILTPLSIPVCSVPINM